MVSIGACTNMEIDDRPKVSLTPHSSYGKSIDLDAIAVNEASPPVDHDFRAHNKPILIPMLRPQPDLQFIPITGQPPVELNIPLMEYPGLRSDIYVLDTVLDPFTYQVFVTKIGWQLVNESSEAITVVDAVITKPNRDIVARLDASSHGYIIGPGSYHTQSTHLEAQINPDDVNELMLDWVLKVETQGIFRLNVTKNPPEQNSPVPIVVPPLLESYAVEIEPIKSGNKNYSQVSWIFRNNSKETITIKEIWITSDKYHNVGHNRGPYKVESGDELIISDALTTPIGKRDLLGLQSEWLMEVSGGEVMICKSSETGNSLCAWMKGVSTVMTIRPTPTAIPSICSKSRNNRSVVKHIFWGSVAASKVTAWIHNEEVGQAKSGGKVKYIAAPYLMEIDLCDANGKSKVGNRLHFKLDGEWAKQSYILESSGNTELNLGTEMQDITTEIRTARDHKILASLYNKRGIMYFDRNKYVGTTYFDKENYNLAWSDFDQAIQIDGTEALYYYNRSLAYTEIGNHSKSVQDTKHACKLNSQYCTWSETTTSVPTANPVKVPKPSSTTAASSSNTGPAIVSSSSVTTGVTGSSTASSTSVPTATLIPEVNVTTGVTGSSND